MGLSIRIASDEEQFDDVRQESTQSDFMQFVDEQVLGTVWMLAPDTPGLTRGSSASHLALLQMCTRGEQQISPPPPMTTGRLA